MPALDPLARGSGLVSGNGLWRPFPLDIAWWKKVLDAYNYPGSVLASVVIVAIACWVLVRRGSAGPRSSGSAHGAPATRSKSQASTC